MRHRRQACRAMEGADPTPRAPFVPSSCGASFARARPAIRIVRRYVAAYAVITLVACDAPADGVRDREDNSSASDTGPDVGTSSGSSIHQDDASGCPTTISDACLTDGGPTYRCVPNSTMAQESATWCGDDGPFGADPDVAILPNCDGFDVVEEGPTFSDYWTTYYYDVGTGALVGIGRVTNGQLTCVAGLAKVLEPSRCNDGSAVGSVCPLLDAGEN